MFSRFPPNSRYSQTKIAQYEREDGESVPYLRRRFLPNPEALAVLREHRVLQGERLDHISAMYLEDPLLFWRVADGNGAMNPFDLISPLGRVLRITLPEGFSGGGNE